MAGFIVPLVAGLGSALTGLFGSKNSGQQQTGGSQTTNQGQTTTGATSTTPVLSDLQRRLADIYTQGYGDLLANADLGGYSSVGQQAIAGQGNANRQIINNLMAARGLSFSPAAAAPLTQNLLNTGNQLSNFTSQIPLLQRQLKQQSLEGVVNAFRSLPTASTSSTSQTGSGFSHVDQFGNVTTSGNPVAGALSGGLAGLFAPNGSGGTMFGDLLASLGLGKPNAGGVTGGTFNSGFNPFTFATGGGQ